jgi:hypothetical protein
MGEKKTPGPPPMTPNPPTVDQRAGPTKKRPPDIKDHIGRQLRALYDEVASQPVPDRFMDLLNRLSEKSRDE